MALKTFHERDSLVLQLRQGVSKSLVQSVCPNANWITAFLYLFWATFSQASMVPAEDFHLFILP